MDSGTLEIVLAIQTTFVTLLFLRALRRSARLSRESAGRHRSPSTAPRSSARPTSPRRRPSDGEDRSALEDEVTRLEEQRAALLAALDRIRAAQVKEEAEFRARRTEVLLDLHERRRVANELAGIEPDLYSRIASLRAEVEHLERRRPELAAEIRASTASSLVLRGRLATARHELAGLRRDRERVRQRLHTEGRRLRDLAHRRALLEAETEELATLARTLERATGGTGLLSRLTDGELRDRSAQQLDDRTHIRDAARRHDPSVDHHDGRRQDAEADDLHRVLHLRHRRLDAGLHERLVGPSLEDLDVLHAASVRTQAR